MTYGVGRHYSKLSSFLYNDHSCRFISELFHCIEYESGTCNWFGDVVYLPYYPIHKVNDYN